MCIRDSYKVLGIKATVQRAEFDHLPNYIAVRYRLQKVSMEGQKVIFLDPKTELEQIEDLKAQLKSTGDAILAECAVKDHIWGCLLYTSYSRNRPHRSEWQESPCFPNPMHCVLP